MSAAPTHRKGSMPKNGGPMRQRVSHHGTKPVIVPGARMKNTSDPSEAQKRRMVHPPMNARHGSERTGTSTSLDPLSSLTRLSSYLVDAINAYGRLNHAAAADGLAQRPIIHGGLRHLPRIEGACDDDEVGVILPRARLGKIGCPCSNLPSSRGLTQVST